MEQPVAAAAAPKRPRGSRGGKRVQELREEGKLPKPNTAAARKLNDKRDKAKRFAEKKALKKARRLERLKVREAETGSIRSNPELADTVAAAKAAAAAAETKALADCTAEADATAAEQKVPLVVEQVAEPAVKKTSKTKSKSHLKPRKEGARAPA